MDQDLGPAAGTLRAGWTGQAADGFQAWAAQLRKDLEVNAAELDRIAGQLDQVAAEIRSKNAQIHELYVAMGVTAAVGIGLTIFTLGFSDEAAVATGVAEAAQVEGLISALSGFLDSMVGKWVLAFAVNLTATGIEKAVVNPDHNPFEGWTPGDLAHALLGADALALSYPIAEAIPAYMRLKAAQPVMASALRSGTAAGVAAFGSDISAAEFEGRPLGWGTAMDVGLSAGVSGVASGVGEWGAARFGARPGRVVTVGPTASEMPEEFNLRVPPPPGLERTESGLLRSAPPPEMERTESGLLRPAPPAGMARTPDGLLRPDDAGGVTVGDRTFTIKDTKGIPGSPVEARAPLPRVNGIGSDNWTERPSGLAVPSRDYLHSQMGLSVDQPAGNAWQQSVELRKSAFKLPVKGINAVVTGLGAPPDRLVTLQPVGVVTPGPAPAVPPPRPLGPPQVVGGGTYTVGRGDSLWAIAHRTYGDGRLWTVLYRANRGIGVDPSLIQPGQVLAIPAVARPAP